MNAAATIREDFTKQVRRPASKSEDKVVGGGIRRRLMSQLLHWLKNKGQKRQRTNSSMKSSSDEEQHFVADLQESRNPPATRGSNWGWNWRIGDKVRLQNVTEIDNSKEIGKIKWLGFVGSAFCVGVEFEHFLDDCNNQNDNWIHMNQFISSFKNSKNIYAIPSQMLTKVSSKR